MKAQLYLEIDYKEMNDEEFTEFNSFLNKYFVYYKKISKSNNREYYYCIMRDDSVLTDSEDEEGNTTYGLTTLLNDRNPIINGLWTKNGLPMGTEIVMKSEAIYNEDDNIETEAVYETIGTPTYPFKLTIHLKYTPDNIVYNEDGAITSQTKVTTFKPLHSYYGWTVCYNY